MGKKRPSAAEAIGDIAPPVTSTKDDSKKQIEVSNPEHKKYGKPATYRLPEELIDQLKNIAKSERVKISDLATFALKDFVARYDEGQIILPKKEDIRYKLDL